MKIAVNDINIAKKIKGHEVHYIFNDKQDIKELLDASKYCSKVTKGEGDYDTSMIDTVEAKLYTKDLKELTTTLVKRDLKFSIIIPNYNNEKWLKGCLESVLNQTYKNFEIIFIDDMSTDNSIDIAKSLLKEHKVIELEQKRYNGGARNVGILEADSDYTLFLDSDDKFRTKDLLKELNDFIYYDDMVIMGYELDWGNKKEIRIPKEGSTLELFKAHTNGYCCAVWTKCIKTQIIKKCLFSEGTLMEDRVHHYRIINKIKSWRIFPKASHLWNKINSNSVTVVRNYKWNNSAYRHLADQLDLLEELEDGEFKEYVMAQIEILKRSVARGVYQQQ